MFLVNEGQLAQFSKVVPKLWGCEFWLTNTDRYCMKLLRVMPGFQSSIHCHKKKDETFIGLSGALLLQLHDPDGRVKGTIYISSGTQYHLKPREFHSFQASNVTWVMEVSTKHDDADVIRLQESRKLEP